MYCFHFNESPLYLVARYSQFSGYFWLFAPKFGKWQGPMDGILSFYAGSVVRIPWGGGDTQTLSYAKEFV